jgi:hypothetical protein
VVRGARRLDHASHAAQLGGALVAEFPVGVAFEVNAFAVLALTVTGEKRTGCVPARTCRRHGNGSVFHLYHSFRNGDAFLMDISTAVVDGLNASDKSLDDGVETQFRLINDSFSNDGIKV